MSELLRLALLTAGWCALHSLLVAEFGEEYRRYQQRVPMLVPWFKRRRG